MPNNRGSNPEQKETGSRGWGSHGQGKYWKKKLHKAERQAVRLFVRTGRERGPNTHYISLVKWKNH